MSIGCILLAAGSAKRFGRNKLMFPIDGKPMVQRAIELHSALAYVRRVLVTQFMYEDVRRMGKDASWEMVYNPCPHQGQSLSIRLGLEQMMNGNGLPQGILFCVSDQPYLTAQSVRGLMDRFMEDPSRIVSLSFDNVRGNPVVFPACLAEELCALTGDVGGAAVIRRHPELVTLLDAGHPKELHDIDWEGDRL